MKHAQIYFILLLFLLTAGGKRLIAAPPLPDSTLPNIVLIVVDDGRYDEYRPTGAPSWFVAPNIERIANEGANFTRTYATTPICGPSRASLFTGLYPSLHGSEVNGDYYDTSLVMIQDILQAQGYYTGFIGKYGTENNIPTGFDWWCINPQEEAYKDITYWTSDGGPEYIPGHLTDVYNAKIQEFLDTAQYHQPFALFFFTNVPHPPNAPRSSEKLIYDAEVMPFPDNFYKYSSVYPDHYYEGTTDWTKDSLQTVKFTKDRFACLKGVDFNVETIFNFLDGQDITDETMIMFASDNGYISGEHLMRAKANALEESFHVPLFVRYPSWFDAGEVIDNDFAELVDIPKTLIEAAGATDEYDYSGISLNALQEPDTMRRYARYELARLESGAFDVPQIRGFRSFDHLYTYTWSDCYVEEIYDMVLDPAQNQNQILNPDYSEMISFYREVLDSLMTAIGDTVIPEVNDAMLVNAYEIEDGIDNDCDGLVDDSITLVTYYPDFDDDGYGSLFGEVASYIPIPGYVTISGDCNDLLSIVHPGALDYCDGIDNDCDLMIDEDIVTPTITAEGPTSFCSGSFCTLTASPFLPGFTYQWYKGALPILGANSISYNATGTGNFKVMMTGPLLCISTSSPVSCTKLSKPKPSISNYSGSNDLCVVAPINLKTKLKPGNTYQWSLGAVEIAGATSNVYNVTAAGSYRVKQTDINGCSALSSAYSVIQSCREGDGIVDQTGAFTLYPNPASESVMIVAEFEATFSGEVAIEIFNNLGARVMVESVDVAGGKLTFNIELPSGIPSGVYFVKLSTDETQLHNQLIIN